MTLRRMYKAPEVPIGHVLNPKRGFFSVIVPLERTNLVTNPSVETNTTGWSGFGSSIAQSTTYSYHGAYSLAVTPTAATSDGAQFDPVSLTAGVTYAYSCKFLGVAGRKYLINVSTTGGLQQTAREFTATGRWQWVWGFWKETSTVTRRIIIRKNLQANTDVFYVDGLQVESCADGVLAPTTYIDGDQSGLLVNQFPYPYYWTGTPHASTSTRLATTRAGGYVVNFDRFRYRVLAYAGLGLTTVANIAAIPAATDGATYQATIARPRQFVVNGYFDSPTLGTLQRAQSDMYDALGPDSATPRQPCVLIYQAHDCERPIGREGRIIASYQAGLEGNQDSPFRENAPISFQAYLPTIQAGESGASLPILATVSNANYILTRTPSAAWSAMGTGGSGAANGVRAFASTVDQSVYAGGDFTSMGGVANTARIAKWDGSAWSALSTGTNGEVFTIAVGPNGTDLYVGGNFTLAGGIANTVRIAKWDGANWTALSTGAAATVNTIVVSPTGIVYAGGAFTTIGGAAINRIAQWDGATWTTVGAGGANAQVTALVIGKDGNLYAGGQFTSIGGVTVDGVAMWNGTTWIAMGSGVNPVETLTVGLNGAIYAGGGFTGTYNYAAVWNGTAWTQMGSLNGTVYKLYAANDGLIYAGGAFTAAGSVTFLDRLARWNGSSWVSGDVSLPGTPTVRGFFSAPDGSFYLGFSTAGSAGAAPITTVTNGGTARTYPVVVTLVAAQSSAIYQLLNVTNGQALYFNYTVAIGEVLRIRTSPSGTTIISSFRGDVTGALLPGSAFDFVLEKGTNTISFLQGKTSATMTWPLCYQSPADLTE